MKTFYIDTTIPNTTTLLFTVDQFDSLEKSFEYVDKNCNWLVTEASEYPHPTLGLCYAFDLDTDGEMITPTEVFA